MKLELTDSAVYNSISTFGQVCLESRHTEKFSQLYENHYHCKIVANPADRFCINGWLEFEDEKYYNWFILQNGVVSE